MKISIITATLNSGRYFEECISSVLAQGPCDFEHIIVDGGSSDETISLAKRHSHLRVVERPGCSIYEAWNIGLDIATGELIGICNSDDFYAPGTFARALDELELHPDAWMVSGKAIQFTRDTAGNDVILREYTETPRDYFGFENLNLFGPAINARFLRRKLVDEFGEFDERFQLASDCSYMMNIALRRLPAVYVDELFYYYRSHPKSSSLGADCTNVTIALEEKLQISNELILGGCLRLQELHHLRRAMALQFATTLVECARHKRWKDMMASFCYTRWLSFGEGIALLGNAATIVWHRIVKRLFPRGRKTQTV
jgi:glycosyltransferase involved in cell wall biosynthesis